MAVKKVGSFNIHETPAINQNEFDVETYLNANWEKTKEAVNNNAEELMQAQKDISTLKEDNKTNKSSIDVLEKSNETINKSLEDIDTKDKKQDEDIKANKETIKEIQAENERLREDIKSIALQGEASGENIHIEDSSNARCEIEICGNQKQNTREGYNLLDLSNFSTQTKNGVTATKNEDGSIKLVGTNSGDTFNINLSTINGEIGDYIASGVTGGSRETYFLAIVQPGVKTFAEVTNGSSNFSLTEEVTIATNIYIIKGATINTTIYPMMIKGTEQKPYEQYGASPSIDYPSKAKSVGDNINMLFTNPDDWEQGTITDGANASSMTRIRTKNFIDIIDNEDYYVSIPNTQYCFLNIVLYKEDKTYIGQYYSLNNAINGANHLKINLPTDAKKIRVIIRNLDNVSDISPSDIEMIKPKLEKSSVATPYSSYNCGSLKTKIGNKNHLSTIPRVTFSLQGIQTTFDGEKFTCKGTAMYNYFNLVTQRIQQHFKAGTYTFSSNMFEKGRACIRFYYEDGTADTYYSHINTKKISFTLKKDAYEYFLMVDGLTVGGGDVIDCIIKLQLEDGNTSTEIVKAENQEFVVDVQQPLLEGDTFVRQDAKWYEKHIWGKKVLNGTEEWRMPASNTKNAVFSNLSKTNFVDYKEDTDIQYCNYLKYDKAVVGYTQALNRGVGLYTYNSLSDNSKYEYFVVPISFASSADEFKSKLKELYDARIPIVIYYKLAEPILLECTEAQSKVLDEIYNKAHTYKNITNILAESAEVNPIASVKYLKDPETEHNKLQVQIDEIKQLLSSTETSALLVNNLEKDLRMEVE